MADVKYARSFAEFTNFSVWEKYVVEQDFIDLPKLDRTPLVFRPDEGLAREIMRTFTWEYPYKGFENLPVKSSATRLLPDYESEQRDVTEEGAVNLLSTAQKKTSKDRGLAYHAFLENFDFTSLWDENGKKIEDVALREIVLETMNGLGRDALKLLSEEKLMEILKNPVFFTLRGKRLYKEQQFLVALPVRDTYGKKEGVDKALSRDGKEEMIFQGAVDLLAVGEDGGAQIIDYKYSKGNAEYLRTHYRPQLDLYRQAVAKILRLDKTKIKCTIVNIYHGFEVNVE